jgi:stage II sporulation protein P
MRCRLFAFILTLILLTIFPLTADGNEQQTTIEEALRYFTLYDEQGQILLMTGLTIRPGDAYIADDNRYYEVVSVEATQAKARYVREWATGPLQTSAVGGEANTASQPLISLYHTHSDECYIPTDGKATTRGNGSIMQVGDAFQTKLTELHYQVDHDKTLHSPHDANAYQRSRRTVMRLLQQQPVALFDIHRDSAPLKIYNYNLKGQDLTKILLVVGRENPNINTTLNYAKNIKTIADNKYKGLIRGIFIAHGGYNQDLNPKSLLIEIGTQYNSLEQAQRSIALFADVLPTIFSTASPVAQTNQASGPGPTAATEDMATSAEPPPTLSIGSYIKDILLMLGLLALGAVSYLYLSTGSIQELQLRLRNFRDKEFINLLMNKTTKLRKKRQK